jgi:CspA family cold shock protein
MYILYLGNMSTQESSQRILGQVKWFNNKAGYGFITVSEGDHSGKDIFIHFTAIRVTGQYKYLSQGEYVEFVLDKSNSEVHELQATDVSGVKGGKLMCEIRRNTQQQPGSEIQQAQGEGRLVNKYRRYKVPRDDVPIESPLDDSGEYTTVRRRRPMGGRGAGRGRGRSLPHMGETSVAVTNA